MMYRSGVTFRGVATGLALSGVMLSLELPGRSERAYADAQQDATLADLVGAFFLSEDPAARDTLASPIIEASGGSIEAVVQAVRSARLWPALPEGHGVFPFESAALGTVKIDYSLPDGYTPALRYPMVLCMPEEGRPQDDPLARVRETLEDCIDGFVLIAPRRSIGGTFYQSVLEVGDLRRLMRRVRRRFHVDSDRVFIFGAGMGGDAAWMAATMHSDLFAGVICVSSYPRLPYAAQSYRILLGNLRRLPLLTVWGSAEGQGATARLLNVAAHNRAIEALAKQASLPMTGLEVSGDLSPGLRPFSQHATEILRGRRAPSQEAVAHWFRYPAQGRTGWLRQARFSGEVWDQDQLSILPSAMTDRDTFITEVIQSKMAYLAGRIVGQTIDIEVRRCARVDLFLPDGLVEFDQPVTVRCNGKERFAGLIRPQIEVLLETAFQEWEFERLTFARFSFSIRTSDR